MAQTMTARRLIDKLHCRKMVTTVHGCNDNHYDLRSNGQDKACTAGQAHIHSLVGEGMGPYHGTKTGYQKTVGVPRSCQGRLRLRSRVVLPIDHTQIPK